MILGITGISGSGKHTAAEFFHKKGYIILDADTIAHNLYRPYRHAWKEVVKRFGEEILNKNDDINRQKLGNIVFADKQALKDLSDIMHPEVKRYLLDELHKHKRRKDDVVIIAALGEQLGLSKMCDKVILIKANEEDRLMRIQLRDGISEKKYFMRTETQKDLKNPNWTIENSDNKKHFY